MCNLSSWRFVLAKLTGTLDPSVWRQRSRVVAYTEIVLSTVGSLLAIFFLLTSLYATIVTQSDEDDSSHKKNKSKSLLRIMWLSVTFFVAITCIDMWASLMLLKATKPGVDPKLALERARIWRYVTIILTVLSAIVTGFSEAFIILAIKLLVRGSFLYIVCKFIAELRNSIELASPSGPDFVVVGT